MSERWREGGSGVMVYFERAVLRCGLFVGLVVTCFVVSACNSKQSQRSVSIELLDVPSPDPKDGARLPARFFRNQDSQLEYLIDSSSRPRRLFLRPAQPKDWYLRISPNSVLQFGIFSQREKTTSVFRVNILPDKESETTVYKAQVKEGETRWESIPLKKYANKIVRLRFEVEESSVAGQGADKAFELTGWLEPTIIAQLPIHAQRNPSIGQKSNVRRPNVIIYLVDTLRADHLSAYGYKRRTSPHLEEFQKDALTFTNYYAQSSWTMPSVATLMTGMYPSSHRAVHVYSGLPNEVILLSEVLKNTGYKTYAFSTNGTAGPEFHFDQGFDYFLFIPEIDPSRSSDELMPHVKWVFANLQEPFYLFIHTMDPHDPYNPEEKYRIWGARSEKCDFDSALKSQNELEECIALYDGDILHNDENFGKFLDLLRQRGWYDSSLILFTSDHGEGMAQHNAMGHGHNLHEEQVRIPLLMKLPEQKYAGTRIDQPLQEVDIMPTLLDYLRLSLPKTVQGKPQPLIPGQLHADPELFYFERYPWWHPSVSFLSTTIRALIAFPWKIHARNDSKIIYEIYDLQNDPLETHNLYPILLDDRPILTRYLISALKSKEIDALPNVSENSDGIPLVGDWNGDGIDQTGIYRPSMRTFFLGYRPDARRALRIRPGYRCKSRSRRHCHSYPLIGDWNGDGIDQTGIYCSCTTTFLLDTNGNDTWDGPPKDTSTVFGNPDDIPLAGDWDGDGKDQIGVYRPSMTTFFLDINANGVWDGPLTDMEILFGLADDVPVIGDWNGDGKDKVGVYRPSADTAFFLDTNGNGVWDDSSADTTEVFGNPDDIPLAGDWNGDGKDKIGVYYFFTHTFFLDANGNSAWDGRPVDTVVALSPSDAKEQDPATLEQLKALGYIQ